MAAHHDSGHHEPGKMDIEEQEKTFAGFVRLAGITCVIIIAILIFMALVNS